MGQDDASVSRPVAVGPLGCLGLIVALVAGLAIGRLPAVLARSGDELRATPLPPAGPPAAAPPAVAAANPPPPIVVTLPAPPPAQVIVVREGGGGGGRADEPAEVRWTLPPAAPHAGDGAPAAVAREPAPAEPPHRAAADADSAGFAVATLAYADLANGDRRAAAAKFQAALALDPDAANAPAWRRQLHQLRQRWSGEGYALLRDDGTPGLGTRPVLGGGQTVAQLAYTPAPLARRPVSIVLRATTANSGGFGGSTGTASSQLAAGVRWQVLPALSLSGERLFALDRNGRSAFTARLAGGLARRVGPMLADVYGEAGIVGLGHPSWFTGVQGRAAYPLALASLRLEPGIGLWSGAQHDVDTTGRLDLGPTLGISWDRWRFRASADYRVRVAGNARPGSGPAVTLSGGF